MKKQEKAFQAKEPICAKAEGMEGPAQRGTGSLWRRMRGIRGKERNKESGHPRGFYLLARKGFEQESDMVRLYLFLLFKSLAAVWRMNWQEGRLRAGTSAKSYCNSPGKTGPRRAGQGCAYGSGDQRTLGGHLLR